MPTRSRPLASRSPVPFATRTRNPREKKSVEARITAWCGALAEGLEERGYAYGDAATAEELVGAIYGALDLTDSARQALSRLTSAQFDMALAARVRDSGFMAELTHRTSRRPN